MLGVVQGLGPLEPGARSGAQSSKAQLGPWHRAQGKIKVKEQITVKE